MDRRSLTDQYSQSGHPSIAELMKDQGLAFPRDPNELLGDFWPEDESIQDFLAALHEWRGHKRSDEAA